MGISGLLALFTSDNFRVIKRLSKLELKELKPNETIKAKFETTSSDEYEKGARITQNGKISLRLAKMLEISYSEKFPASKQHMGDS